MAAVQDCLPQDEARELHRRAGAVGCGARPAGLSSRADARDEQGQAARDPWFPGLSGKLCGAKVEELTPKTRLQSYYEYDYDSLLAVLKKNRKKLAIHPARREPGETLRAEFESSMNKLLPLRERIERTDRLIDAVVYRLYGLTEEEIGIVEGE